MSARAPDLPPTPGGAPTAPTARAAGGQPARDTSVRPTNAAAGTPPSVRVQGSAGAATGTMKGGARHPFNDSSFMAFKKNTEWLVTLAGFRHFGWNKSSVKMMVLNDKNVDEAAKLVTAKDWAGIHGMISSSPLPEKPQHNISFEESDGFVPVRRKVKRSVLFFLHGKRMTSFRVIPYKSTRYIVSVTPDIGTLDPEGNRAVIIEITLEMPFTTGLDLEIPLVFWRGDQEMYMKMVEFGKYANFDVFVCPLRSQVECTESAFIDPEKVKYDKKTDWIGSGSTGAVYRGKYCGEEVACKVLFDQKGENTPAGSEDDFMENVTKMKQIPQHDFIVRFRGAVAEPGNCCLVMELCPYGSLLTSMKGKQTNAAWTNLMKVRAMYDCARAMNFLHQNGIIHRDLKLDNLLVVSLDPNSQVVCKLSDFGSMKKKQRTMGQSFTMSKTGLAGTLLFTAPEMFGNLEHDPDTPDTKTPEEKGKCSNKVDVFSFGVTLAGTINGRQPYEGQSFSSEFDFARRVLGGMRPEVKNADSWPRDLITLMKQCWGPDPHKRPSFEIIVEQLQVVLKSLRGPSRRP